MFIIKFDLKMLTKDQKAEAEKKLKNMNEELSQDEHLRSTAKKATKNIMDVVASLKDDPKKQLELLKKLANQDLPSKIALLERTSGALTDAQEKVKNQKDRFNKESLNFVEERGRFEGGIEEIKRTIVNIKKTVAESIEDQSKKRAQIESNLQKSLEEIRGKIKEFTEETQNFNKQNAEMQEKVDALKAKLSGVEDSYKVKAEEKDEEVKGQKEELNEKLKELQAQVQAATQSSKEYTALEKKNFDNKLALYLKTKKFPQLCSSFQSSANTLDSCKQQLLKGVTRINIAGQTIGKCNGQSTQISDQILSELRRQKEKEGKIDQVKKEKDQVRGSIIDLQNKLKAKKNNS